METALGGEFLFAKLFIPTRINISNEHETDRTQTSYIGFRVGRRLLNLADAGRRDWPFRSRRAKHRRLRHARAGLLHRDLQLRLYATDRLNDRNGNKVNSVTNNPGPGPGVTLGVDVDVDVYALAPTFIWVSPWKILGAKYGAYFSPAFGNTSVGASLATQTGRVVARKIRNSPPATCTCSRSGWTGAKSIGTSRWVTDFISTPERPHVRVNCVPIWAMYIGLPLSSTTLR